MGRCHAPVRGGLDAEPGAEFDVQTAPSLEGLGENIPPAIGEDAIDTGDRVVDGVR